MFNSCKNKAHKRSTEFSDFIRNASSREKKRVYSEVLQKATEQQLDIIRRASTIK
jgi:hypothetical protein